MKRLEALKKYNGIEIALEEAKEKHPVYPMLNLHKQMSILTEEVGEVAQAILKYEDEGGKFADIQKELEQVGAMVMRMLENLHLNK